MEVRDAAGRRDVEMPSVARRAHDSLCPPRAALERLASVAGELRAQSLPELPDARLEEDFADLQRSIEQLEVERLRRLAEIDRRRLFERDGHLSAASWLAVRHRMAWGTARYQVRVGRAFDDMPATRRALDDGAVSLSAARLLASAHEVDPEAFCSGERELVDAASRALAPGSEPRRDVLARPRRT